MAQEYLYIKFYMDSGKVVTLPASPEMYEALEAFKTWPLAVAKQTLAEYIEKKDIFVDTSDDGIVHVVNMKHVEGLAVLYLDKTPADVSTGFTSTPAKSNHLAEKYQEWMAANWDQLLPNLTGQNWNEEDEDENDT